MAAHQVSLAIFAERLALMLGGIVLGIAILIAGFRYAGERRAKHGFSINRFSLHNLAIALSMTAVSAIFVCIFVFWPS